MTSSAFQVWASKWTEGHVVDALRCEDRDISPELLEREFEALRDIQEGRVKAMPSKEEAIGRAVQLAEPVAWSLLGRAWVVHKTPPIMMTSDEPVILIGGPGHPRGRRPGTEDAGVVAYPLDPENLLVLFRPDMRPLGDPVLNHADMADINGRSPPAPSAGYLSEEPATRRANSSSPGGPRPCRSSKDHLN